MEAAIGFVNSYFFSELDALELEKEITRRQTGVIKQKVQAQSMLSLAILELFVRGERSKEELIDDIFLLEKHKEQIVIIYYSFFRKNGIISEVINFNLHKDLKEPYKD